MRRRATSGLIAAVCIVITAFVAAAPASANDGEPLTPPVVNGTKITKQYPGMPANDGSSAFTSDPETCAQVPWCTTIPITPKYPDGFDPETEWVMDMVVSWDTKPIVEGTASSNDLDVYVYKKETTTASDGSQSTTYTEIGRSASGSEPERVKIYGPPPGPDSTLYVVVYNFVGVNLGFQVDMSVKVFNFVDPSTYRQPEQTRPSGSAGGLTAAPPSTSASEASAIDAPSTPPYRPRALVPATPSQLPAAAPTSAPAVPAIGGLNPAFAGFEDARGLAADLSGPGAQSILTNVRNRAVGPVKHVPAAVAIFWFLALPIVIMGVALSILLRRRPAALRIAV